jgi:hypothetical protein
MIIWYTGVLFFSWTIAKNIRSGEAGVSGIELSRNKNPMRFWIRASWSILIAIFMALMPVIVYLKRQS